MAGGHIFYQYLIQGTAWPVYCHYGILKSHQRQSITRSLLTCMPPPTLSIVNLCGGNVKIHCHLPVVSIVKHTGGIIHLCLYHYSL